MWIGGSLFGKWGGTTGGWEDGVNGGKIIEMVDLFLLVAFWTFKMPYKLLVTSAFTYCAVV